MKWIFRILAALVAVLVAAGIWLAVSMDSIVMRVVNEGGSKMLGVPVRLDGAKFALAKGDLQLTGLAVGNPEGFSTNHAFSVGEMAIDLDVSSLLKSTMVIHRVFVDAPDISIETANGKNNFQVIAERVSAGRSAESQPSGGKPAPAPEPAPREEPGRKFIIEDFLIQNAHAKVTSQKSGGSSDISIPTVHIKDIGKSTGGATGQEVAQRISTEVLQQVLGAGIGTRLEADAESGKRGKREARIEKALGGLLNGGGK